MSEIIELGKVSEDVAKESVAIAEKVLVEARSIIVRTDDDYVSVGESLKSDKKYLAIIETERKKAVDPLNGVIKTINNWFRTPKENLEKAIDIKGSAMQGYQTKKAEVARIEQAKLQDKANKESEKLAEQARKAAEKGNEAKAEELRQQALMKQAVVPQVQVEAPKVAGLTTRDTHYAEVVDFKVFAEWCIKTENIHLIMVNDKELGVTARQAKGTRQIPGVVFKVETKMAGSR